MKDLALCWRTVGDLEWFYHSWLPKHKHVIKLLDYGKVLQGKLDIRNKSTAVEGCQSIVSVAGILQNLWISTICVLPRVIDITTDVGSYSTGTVTLQGPNSKRYCKPYLKFASGCDICDVYYDSAFTIIWDKTFPKFWTSGIHDNFERLSLGIRSDAKIRFDSWIVSIVEVNRHVMK